MKKMFRKQCLGYVLGAVLLGNVAVTFGAEAPKVTVTTQEVTKESLSMTVSVGSLPAGTKAVEVGFVSDDLSKMSDLQWSSDLQKGQHSAHLVQLSESEKEVKFLLVAPKEQSLVNETGLLELGMFTFESQIQGEMDFKEGSAYIKVIGEGYEPTTYTKVQLGHTHKSLEGGNGNGNGDDNNGNDNGNGDNNNDNNNGTGQDSSGSNASNKVDKPKEKEPMVPLEPALMKFVDLEGHWAEDAILRMSGKGILKGYEDGTFRPTQQITRGEFATVLARAFDFKTDSKTTVFEDVATGQWYTEAITSLYEKGIVNGRADGTFGVKDQITNEEMAVMLWRAQSSLGETLPQKRVYTTFKDEAQISDLALEAVKVLYEAELMNGMPDGTFGPKAPTTRAQVAVMLDRMMGLDK